MKKLLFILFAFCAQVSMGQNAAPSGTLSLIPSPAMYYRPADSTVHMYKGSAYLWNRFLTSKDSAKLAMPYFTATRIPFATTGGKLTDNANLTFTTSTGSLRNQLSSTKYITLNSTTAQQGVRLQHDASNYLSLASGTSSANLFGQYSNLSTILSVVGFRSNSTESTIFTNRSNTTLGYDWSIIHGIYGDVPSLTIMDNVYLIPYSVYALISNGGSYDLKFGDYNGGTAGNGTNTDIYSEGALGIRVTPSGNIGMGYSSGSELSSNRLAVNGTALFNGALTVKSSGFGVGKVLTSDANGLLTYATPWTSVGYVVSGGALGTPLSGTLTNCTFPTLNQNTTGSAATLTTSRTLAGNSFNGSANVPFMNKFVVQGTTDAGLTGAQFLGSLSTGIVKNTTTTGVLSVATGADLPSMTATVGGAVPTPPNNTTTFLRGDGTFATPAGSGGTVTSVSALTLGTSGTDLSSTVATGTTTPVITLNVPTASASNRGVLSSADWTNFNGKASGAGTLNYVPKYSATGLTLANSQLFDNGTFVGVGYTTDPDAATFVSKLAVSGNIQASGVADIWTGIYSPIHLGGSGTASSLTLQTTTGIGAAGSNIYFKVGSNGGTVPMTLFYNGLTAIGTGTASNAYLTIGGGATGGVAPLVIKSGTLLAGGSTVAGAIENDGTHLYYTPVAAGTRYQLDQQSGGGSGTVTSVSVTTANGVSGTVATATTTPAISLTLGDITPSKVNTLYVDARKAGSATGNNIWIGDGGRSSTGATSTQGSYNTVSGWSAGGLMSSSSFNSAFGYGSLANQTTGGTGGGGNTGFGASSLGYISTGYSNTAIGSNAGAGIVGNSTGNTTSINSVYVGYNTNAKVNGGDNEIVIGGATDGNGSNTATIGNASVTNTYIRGLTYDYAAVTTTYTVLMTDHIVVLGGTTAYTATLPSAVTAGAGREFILKRTSTVAGTITIAPVSSQTIDGTAGNNTTLLGTNYNKVHLVSNGTNWLTL